MMKTRTLCCAAGLLLLAGCRSEQPVRPKELRCENLTDPLAIDSARPHFSWKTDAGGDFRQSGYEIRVAADSTELLGEGAGLWNSGRVASGASVLVPYEGRPLASPSLAYWKVRVWDDAGRVSAWSAIRRFGVGILEPSGWTGDWIGLPGTECPLLRRRFEVADTERTHLLHVASLGYHEVYVNGRKVSDRVLAPAVSELGKRALSVTYDITSLLAEGRNEVVVWLGPGWYRRDTFRDASTDGPFVNVRLDEIAPEGPRTLLVSDTSWQGGESGYMPTPSATWRPLAFGGECVDGSRVPADLTPETLDGRTWRPVATARLSGLKISPQMCEPNVVRDTLHPRSLRRIADSVWVADMGREFNGWIELRMTGLKKGQRIAIDYSDWTNDDGSYRPQENNSNFEDLYIASGEGTEVFRNRFDHHAFQYLRIRGLAEEPAMLAGYAIQGGYADASTFECSDTDLNAIYDMVEYTLRNLAFGGYVVDCPHLERMGYGGDGNASCRTFQTLFDAAPLYMNWLQMWADCIRDDGGMPHNVPNPYPAGGGPYWCGFLITASWQTYLNYGDFRPVERYYPVMQRWLEYVDRYTVDGLLGRWPDTDYRGWYLGDWLAPEGVDYTAQESVDLVSNCYLCECLDALSKMAALLGREEEAARYGERLQALRTRIGEKFYDPETARYATGSQIDQIYPMLAGVTASEEVPKVTQRLFRETRERLGGHIGCGLVGVTVLTDWAIREEQADFVCSMLRKRDVPGYLAMIDRGATTTWEHWAGDRSRIHNCFNGIGAWFVQALGGIRPDERDPGYRHILFRPQTPAGIRWVRATKETPYGTAAIDWEIAEGRFAADIVVPANSTATFFLPDGVRTCELDGRTTETPDGRVALAAGRHTLACATGHGNR